MNLSLFLPLPLPLASLKVECLRLRSCIISNSSSSRGSGPPRLIVTLSPAAALSGRTVGAVTWVVVVLIVAAERVLATSDEASFSDKSVSVSVEVVVSSLISLGRYRNRGVLNNEILQPNEATVSLKVRLLCYISAVDKHFYRDCENGIMSIRKGELIKEAGAYEFKQYIGWNSTDLKF